MREKKGFTPPFWQKTSNASSFAKRAGFTLIEVIIVIAILIILVAVTVPITRSFIRHAYSTEAREGLRMIHARMEVVRAEYGAYNHGINVNAPVVGNIPGISEEDLNGTYFQHDDYTVWYVNTDRFSVMVSGKPDTPVEGIELGITHIGEIIDLSEGPPWGPGP